MKCIACGRTRARVRRLCGACYMRAKRAGTLTDYSRTYLVAADVVEDTAILRARGLKPAEIATTLGITWNSVYRAHRRHQERAA